MLKKPLLTEQDIVNVEDEYALIREIMNTIECLTNIFTQECTDIQNNYKITTETKTKDYFAKVQKIVDECDQEISKLEYIYKNDLDSLLREFQSKEKSNNQDKKTAKQNNETQQGYAIKKQNDAIFIINERKKQIRSFLDRVEGIERSINVKMYKKIADTKINVSITENDCLTEIMSCDPFVMAKEIKELDENFVKKLLNSSFLRKKCEEFYSLCRKTKLLYDKEMEKLDKDIAECEVEKNKKITEATNVLNYELELLFTEFEVIKEKHEINKIKLQTNLEKQKKNTFQENMRKLEMLKQTYENEQKIIQNNRQNDLMNAYKKYQENHLYNLPPLLLRKFIDSIVSRKIETASEFKPSTKEPLNVTVGNIYFKFDKFLENKIIKPFIDQNYDFIVKDGSFVFPYTIAMNEKMALCYQYSNKEAEKAKEDVQNLCMSMFLSTPPNKMRFSFIDPLKSGQSFAVFKHFEEENSSSIKVISGGIQTDSSSVEKQLQIIVDHIKTMQVDTFKGRYNSIREYNAENILNPQPYSVLGIMDFPAGFSQKSIELLSQIVATGKVCGVYVILMTNEELLSNLDSKLKVQIENIENMCTCYKYSGYTCVNISDEEKSNLEYLIDKPLHINEILNIALVMKHGIKSAGRIVVEYENIAPSKDSYLKFNTNNGIDIPIGLSGASDIQSLRLGEAGSQAVHALICGQIGSGKSRLLHSIIVGALLKYPKEELQIYLIDFKSGTEFKIYADYNIPNFKVIAMESEQEFGLSVLRDLRDERNRRSTLFNSATKYDVVSYNNSIDQTSERLPRILVIIDEFHMLFSNKNTLIANEASSIMEEILRLDRSFGFHMVLCSQSIRGMSAISDAALAQIAVRIALKCPKEDADLVLGEGSSAIKQIEENDAGSAIYVPSISSPKANNKFKVGYLSLDKHTKLLEFLDNHYLNKGIESDTRVLISNVSDNRNSVFQKYYVDGEIIAQDRVIHLGESLKVNSKFEICFKNASANNMLLIGKNSQKAQNLLFFATLDLVLQKVNQIRNGSQSSVINVLNYCDGAEVVYEDRLQYLGENVSQLINYYNGEDAINGIESVYNNLVSKQAGSPDEWLIISNLELASDIQSGSVYGSYRETANQFEQILREGPAKGVFVIAWCADPVLYRSKFSNTFQYFNKRVVFDVSKEFAQELADIVDDDSINKNNAYIYQKGKGKEKFRPYSTPMKEWVKYISDERLKKEL